MKLKALIKKLTPEFLIKLYHYKLALLGAIFFGFPSYLRQGFGGQARKLIVIGVTGTSGKSTTVDFITRILEEAGNSVVSNSSVRFKIGSKEWPNDLKMSMPGRFFMQKLLRQGVKEKCKYAVLEITSEGIKQYRHKFIQFDAAVFTNLSPEHIESHGGFENYRNEKLKLFKATENIHVINIDDENAKYFANIPARKKYFFGIKNNANLKAENVNGVNFTVNSVQFNLNLLGDFNVYNALSAIAVATSFKIPLEICKNALEKVKGIPGRMEVVIKDPLVIVDYAHTPEQLEKVYQTFSNCSENSKLETRNSKLVCVLGSCGGGRDKWKRPVLGKIAAKYCKEIIITNEDPYDEDPLEIMEQVANGIENHPYHIVLDRKEAIKKAIELAKSSDTVIITGKGSESWMCVENGKKIPWDDREIAKEALKSKTNY